MWSLIPCRRFSPNYQLRCQNVIRRWFSFSPFIILGHNLGFVIVVVVVIGAVVVVVLVIVNVGKVIKTPMTRVYSWAAGDGMGVIGMVSGRDRWPGRL